MIFGIKRSLIHHIVNEHQVDATSIGALFEDAALEHFFGAHGLFAQICAAFVACVESFKLSCVSIEGLVEIGHFVGIKEGYVLFELESAPEESIEYHTIVHVAHTGLFSALIVFKNDEVIELVMPYRIEHSGTGIADTTLTATA